MTDGGEAPLSPENGNPLLAFPFAWFLKNLETLAAERGDRRRRRRLELKMELFCVAEKQKHARTFARRFASPLRKKLAIGKAGKPNSFSRFDISPSSAPLGPKPPRGNACCLSKFGLVRI